MDKYKEFDLLKGRILTAIIGKEDDTVVTFVCDNGQRFKLYHEQDCCEYVWLAEVIGDMQDLIGTPLLVAEEVSGESITTMDTGETWTFYKLATIKGAVDLRWCGQSNGYYSEAVNFAEVPNG